MKAAFQATYADWKLIKTRQCVQIVFEVDLSKADEVYGVMGGMPDASKERWFAIARINLAGSSTTAPASEGADGADAESQESASAPRSWHSMSPAQQAGILCGDDNFRTFLRTELQFPAFEEDEAAFWVRQVCGVASRASIGKSEASEAKWRELVSQYRDWNRTPEYVD